MAMVVTMITDQASIKTKHELIRSLYKPRIAQIEVIEPYDPSRANEVTKAAKMMSYRSGQVTVILLRTT
jgi:TPP-dependent indolepyruvate ferredoxin oxidoreductase alpha subunit